MSNFNIRNLYLLWGRVWAGLPPTQLSACNGGDKLARFRLCGFYPESFTSLKECEVKKVGYLRIPVKSYYIMWQVIVAQFEKCPREALSVSFSQCTFVQHNLIPSTGCLEKMVIMLSNVSKRVHILWTQ